MKWTVREAGEWFRLRRRAGLLRCCDCGLVHRYDTRVRGRAIEVRMFRQGKKR